MTKGLTVAFAAAILFVASACNRTSKPGPQAALDDAYKAGLLTNEEYAAKRAAITAAAASTSVAKAATQSAAKTETAEGPVTVDSVVSSQGASAPTETSQPSKEKRPKETRPKETSRKETSRSSARPAPPAEPPEPQSRAPRPSVASPEPSREIVSSPKVASSPKEDSATPAPVARAEAKEPDPTPLSGCEDADFRAGGQVSSSRFYAAPPDVVHRVAVSALESLDFNIRTNTIKEIEATKKRNIGVIVGKGGERVVLTFHKQERNGQSGTSVVGETKKNFVGRVTQKTWTEAVLAQMGCKLQATSK